MDYYGICICIYICIYVYMLDYFGMFWDVCGS